MSLHVVPSPRCQIHQILVPEQLRTELGLDLGDWLLFNTTEGVFSVIVSAPYKIDALLNGRSVAFVSPDSPILFSKNTDVEVEHHNITIGCDPEFFLLGHKGRLLSAEQYLPYDGKIGSDAELAELRPDFALCPEQLMENINRLIKQVPARIPKGVLPYAASSYSVFCSGFHIHLGLPIELLSFAAEETDSYLKNLVSIMDYLVGIPSNILDEDTYRVNSNKFGKPGDYKLNMRTLEYRTPGGFHLRTPEYTEKLFCTSFKVIEKILEESERLSDGWSSMENVYNLDFFRNKYSIPTKNKINELYKTTKTADDINIVLNKLLDEYQYVVDIKRRKENPNFTKEWLRYEKKQKINILQKKGNTTTIF